MGMAETMDSTFDWRRVGVQVTLAGKPRARGQTQIHARARAYEQCAAPHGHCNALVSR